MKKSDLSIFVFLVILSAVFLVFRIPSQTANGGASKAAERQSTEKIGSIDKHGTSISEGEQLRESRRHARNEVGKAKLIQLQSGLELLRKQINGELLMGAGGLDVPDNEIRKVLPEFLEAKRDLEACKINGLGDLHPTVLAKAEQIEAMKMQLDAAVENLKSRIDKQIGSISETNQE